MLKITLRRFTLTNHDSCLRRFASARVKEILHRHENIKRDEILNLNAAKPSKLANLKPNDDASQLGEAVEAVLFDDVESTAATIFLKSNRKQFKSVERKREEQIGEIQAHLSKKLDEETHLMNNIHRPLNASDSLKILSAGKQHNTSELLATDFDKNDKDTSTCEKRHDDVNQIIVDRGFFVHADGIYEEYFAGSADALPESEMNEEPYEIFGFEEGNSVEKIEFQQPGQGFGIVQHAQRLARRAKREILEEGGVEASDMLSDYGKEGNLSVPPLKDTHCSGCGANFHCNHSSLPGFVPFEMFWEIVANRKLPATHQRTNYLCRRCFLYKEYKFLLNVNVCEIDYVKTMGHLKLVQEALILLVVDMADIECSIHRALPEIIGTNKPMIVVGNKLDLLPPDAERGYLKRYHKALQNALQKAGFAENFNILKFSLVSAKTGFGVEDLITNIYTKWVSPRGILRSNIYVVGCTNAGKSTLFNAFLQSDLCKVRALDLVERVTTSPWPGTTLSLLKFPIWNPTAYKLEQRRRRLIDFQKWMWKETKLMSDLYKTTRDPRYITLQGRITNTFKKQLDEDDPVSDQQASGEFFGEVEMAENKTDEKRLASINLNNKEFANGNWCYDTPGTVNREQILDLFTLEELLNVIPRSMIMPRTFIIYAGETLLIGGVARVDILSAKKYSEHEVDVFLTVFASDRLPIHHMRTSAVDEFMKKYYGTEILRAPLGDEHRLQQFPKLKYKKFSLKNTADNRYKDSFGDVVFSSIGWASVTSWKAEHVFLNAWTPDARGLFVREPLVRNASLLRGRRIPGTSAYESALPIEAEQSIYLRGQINRPVEMAAVTALRNNDITNDEASENAAAAQLAARRPEKGTVNFDLA